MQQQLKEIEKENQRYIHRLFRHSILSANREDGQVWFRKDLIKTSGKFSLSLRFGKDHK